MKIRIILLTFAFCTLYPLTTEAEYEQAQLKVVNDLTTEFEISGKNFAKPTAEAIRKRFNNETGKDFTAYSDVLFQGADSFKYAGKNSEQKQETVDNSAWDKAVNVSKRAAGNSNAAGSVDQGAKLQEKCEKYGKITECKQTGESK